MRILLPAIAGCFSGFFALGLQASPSDLIRDHGLTGAIDSLKSQAILSESDRLALGGISFLRAVEKAYQARWEVGYTDNDIPLPLFSNSLPRNPDPIPVAADTINNVFQGFLNDMMETDAILALIPAGSDPSFELALPDVWFDINMNGARDDEESFADIALQTVMSRWDIRRMQQEIEENPDQPDPLQATIRFDEADLHWLRAYAHAISGISELVLAFDPEPEVQKVLNLRRVVSEQATSGLDAYPHLKELLELAGRAQQLSQAEQDAVEQRFEALSEEDQQILRENFGGSPGYASEFAHFIDIAAVVIETLRHTPDQTRAAKAQAHFLEMMAHNRNFWAQLKQETDNDREWIPNTSQTAALGIEMPGEIDEAWLAVLGDAEKMLKGELLVPFWRYGPGYGIDLQAWIDNPGPLNPVGWIQGMATLPYARKGEVMTTENWERFQRLVQRQTGLFVFMLN